MNAIRRFRLVAPTPCEDDEHASLAKALRYAIGEPGVITPHRVMWRSIEHGRNASADEGARRKRNGVVRGCPDVEVFWWHRLYCIELKRTRWGVVSDEQVQMHKNLRLLGHEVYVARGWADAFRWLSDRVPMRRIAV